MSVSRHDVEHVAALARLSFSPEEITKLAEELNEILRYMEQLNSLDTAHVEPLSQVVELSNVLRDDTLKPSLPRESALRNACRERGQLVGIGLTPCAGSSVLEQTIAAYNCMNCPQVPQRVKVQVTRRLCWQRRDGWPARQYRRGWWLDRMDRRGGCDARRATKRGRRSGPCLLQTRWRGADRDRRESPARIARS